MPAYYIALRHAMKSEDEMKTYLAKAPASVVNHPYKQVVGYGRVRTTHGADPGVVAIMEFPTFAAAEAWYESPLYQDAAKHLYAAAEMQCFIVEGMPQAPPAALPELP
jgi:uncharacterized protein (DUF1330 family)